jgi:hypothetical protein
VQVVAGLSLKNLHPRVWDPESPYFLDKLRAVMVSYADIEQMPVKRRKAMRVGLHGFLDIPKRIEIYLDNGAFFFARNGGEASADRYRRFIRGAKPDWRPVRFDAIPLPKMSAGARKTCYRRTMAVNRSYQHDGYVPVIHVGDQLSSYLDDVIAAPRLAKKKCFALGGLVPNLLRTPKAAAYGTILDDLISVRKRLSNKRVHVFGIGGTATLHLAAILGFNSVDSSGWRNRAARGIVQMPGSGERVVAELGNWRGRRPKKHEWSAMKECGCPACMRYGVKGLKAEGLIGFSNRATHNLWVLLEESDWLAQRIRNGTYKRCYKRRLDNTVYLPLIEEILRRQEKEGHFK